jgi:hypothetical protein
MSNRLVFSLDSLGSDRIENTVPNSSILACESVRVGFTLRLEVYSQSVRLGVKPLETQDQIDFFLN